MRSCERPIYTRHTFGIPAYWKCVLLRIVPTLGLFSHISCRSLGESCLASLNEKALQACGAFQVLAPRGVPSSW
jgi:hypothetical protein